MRLEEVFEIIKKHPKALFETHHGSAMKQNQASIDHWLCNCPNTAKLFREATDWRWTNKPKSNWRVSEKLSS